MLGKLSGWNDTIVALATPPGVGAIGVIRISGNNAITISNKLFFSKDLEAQKTHTLHVGLLRDEGVLLDEVVVSIYKGPASYTGENTIEISSHGSPYVQEKIINAITKRGARLAKPGEFTQRAFLNGKLDLTQAEAVADLILSNSEISRKTALQNIRGGFSEVLKKLRDQLLSFSALIELELDFSQEDVEFADRTQLYNLLTSAAKITSELIESFALGNVIKNGVQVAIIGKPNVGKSTLLNALLNENRAIVSNIAGTTRDTIEEVLNIEGILFRLIDTAGIRSDTDNEIEALGVEKSLEKLRQADVVIYLFDASEIDVGLVEKFAKDQEASNKKYILVGNKSDQVLVNQLAPELEKLDPIFISAKEKTNLDLLKHQLVQMVFTGEVDNESVVVTNARHYQSLLLVQSTLAEIISGMDIGIQSDLLSLDIRRCLHYLGEITGEITNEDQLDYIFSKFCIGK